MYFRLLLTVLIFCFAAVVRAGDVEVVNVSFSKRGDGWDVSTTLRHADTGWEHYADAWRVTTPDGHVLGTRTLYHPHVDEQPFTRSLHLPGAAIPAAVTVVFVEAHDKVHGWGSRRVKIDLTTTTGPRYRINR